MGFLLSLVNPRNRNHKSLANGNHNIEITSFSRRNRSVAITKIELGQKPLRFRITPLWSQQLFGGVSDLCDASETLQNHVELVDLESRELASLPSNPCFFFWISLRFSFSDFPCFLCFFLYFPSNLGVPRRERPLLFRGFPLFFSKIARGGGSGFRGCFLSHSDFLSCDCSR